jgi:uncharacterized protein (TIGR02246 family)
MMRALFLKLSYLAGLRVCSVLALAVCLTAAAQAADKVSAAGGKEPQDNAQQEAALMKTAEAFVEAFDKGDAKAVAAFWLPDGDYVEQTGRLLKGRKAIEEAFAGFFAESKGMKLRIDVASMRFLNPDTAIEDGTTAVIPPDGAPPSRARYTNVHVKQDGRWYLASVREAVYAPPSNYEHLRGLEWAIGEWVDDSDGQEVGRVSFEWSPEQNFILSSHVVAFKDISLGDGTEWIGWDPAAAQVRSWSFESDGGFGEGFWTKEGDKWIIKTNSVLHDGKKLAATNVVTRVGADTITWQSKDRTLDGKALPDSAEIKMKRVK